jgi:hypothetical protein
VQKHEDQTSERGVTKSPSLRSIKAAREEASVNGNGSKPATKRTSAPAKPKRKIVKA